MPVRDQKGHCLPARSIGGDSNIRSSIDFTLPNRGKITMSNPVKSAQQISKSNIGQTSQALIIQTYANSVNEQPAVDFTGEPTLAAFQPQINAGLTKAQGHATSYLNVIQPNIIQNITNI